MAKRTPNSGPPSASWSRPWSIGLLLALVTIVAYLPALRAGFIWDDDAYVTENQTLHDTPGLKRIWFDVQATPQYYPLVHTTFWLEYHSWGLNPIGYHLVNVLLHAFASILLWRVLLYLRLPGAWLAAGIFALHPGNVESVAWITERKNVLSAVFYFAAALAYLRHSDLKTQDSRLRTQNYCLALLLFTCALLSKSVTCSLPAALLLVCWWKKGRVTWRDVQPLLSFFIIGILFGLHTAWVEKHHVGAQGAEWSLTFLERCLIAGRAFWFYLAKLIWPTNLTFIYPLWDISTAAAWQWLFPLAAIALILTLWFARNRIGRGPLVAALFFAGTLLPALGFIDVYPMRYSFVADHFQYLASVAPLAFAAVGIIAPLRFLEKKESLLLFAVPALLLLLLATLTWGRTYAFRDSETLWRDNIATNPASWLAHNNLGGLLKDNGDIAEAEKHFREALKVKPDYSDSLNNLGSVLREKGQFDEAIKLFEQALALKPDSPLIHVNLGNAYAAQNKPENAFGCYEVALRLDPHFALAHYNLGNLLRSGNPPEAMEHYRLALQSKPTYAEAHFQIGTLYASKGDKTNALSHWRDAVRYKPDFTPALNSLAWTLATDKNDAIRNGAEAVTHAERLVALTHSAKPEALDTLSTAYAENNRFPEAISTAQKAMDLASSSGNERLTHEIRAHLDSYKAGRPWRE